MRSDEDKLRPWYLIKDFRANADKAQTEANAANLAEKYLSEKNALNRQLGEADAQAAAAFATLAEALESINMMACYASEEDIHSRAEMLLHIGRAARTARALAQSNAEIFRLRHAQQTRAENDK
jgi:F420-dependent methylenetetrahydromethanopterin dehydrogenase